MPKSPCAFIDQVPEYEARDGRVYISMGDQCLAMPIRVFQLGCLLGQEAIAKWQLAMLDAGSKVIPFSLGAGS